MKLLVETKDNLQVFGDGEEMHAHFNRPSVVRQSRFMSSHVTDGNLTMLAQLTDEASDADFVAEWDKCESDKAREELKTAYAEQYAPGKVADKTPPKKA